MGFVDDVRKATAPLASRIGAMIKRAVIERIDDTKGTQTVQVSLLAGEVADGCEHMQPFGLSFHPVRGSDAVALAVQGDPGHLLVISATKRGIRPTGAKEGEGGLYDKTGVYRVFVDENGVAHLGAKEGAAKMARADRVEAELTKIKTTLGSLSGGDQSFGTSYSEVGSVGADNVKGT